MSGKKLFAQGQKEPKEAAGTFVAEVACEASGEEWVVNFLSSKVPEELLLVGRPHVSEPQVCALATEESNKGIREQYADILTELIRPVAQTRNDKPSECRGPRDA